MTEVIEPTTAIATTDSGMSVPAPAAPLTPLEMISNAVARGASIEMVERLMALQEKMEANEARKAFVAAMAQFKAVPIRIEKNKGVAFGDTAYKHATLDQIVAAVGPELARAGLSYRWKTEQIDGGMIRVTCIVRHQLGHSEETMLQAGADQSGKKNNVQAIGSTCSYLERYTLMAALGLASADMDDDGKASEDGPITMEQVEQIQDGLSKAGGDIKAFCQYFRVGSLAELKAGDLRRAWEMINAKRSAAEKAAHQGGVR